MTSPDKRPAGLDTVSDHTTQRISVYLRWLDHLASAGTPRVSSRELAEACRLNPAQIRRDLASLGAFGVRGVGYSVPDLRRRLREIMGLDREHRIAIVGAGNLGRALADYGGFHGGRFRVVAMFDSDPSKVGTRSRRGVEVHHVLDLPTVTRRKDVDIAMIAVPAEAARDVADVLSRSGIRAVLNFTPALLELPPGPKVTSVDLSVLLDSLAFFLAREAHD